MKKILSQATGLGFACAAAYGISSAPHQALLDVESCYAGLYPTEGIDKGYAWLTGVQHPLYNLVLHLSCHDQEVAVVLDELIARLPPGTPIGVLVHEANQPQHLPETLTMRGFQSLGTLPLMTWDVHPLEEVLESDVRQVATLDRFLDILCNYYQIPRSVLEPFYSKVLFRPGCENYMIYKQDVPVGTATLVRGSEGVGGIFNDAALERYGAGMTLELTRHIMVRCRELGLSRVVLWSAHELVPAYTALGFQKAMTMELYVR